MSRLTVLVRRDLTSSAATSRHCLLVYPPSKKSKQRFAVGDRTGEVRVYAIGKRLECELVFSTSTPDGTVPVSEDGVPAVPPTGGSRQNSLSCATLYSDQLFALRRSVLTAYSRKGKQFFTVDTNATDQIHALVVSTPYFFIAGDFMLTAFQEAKELGFYMSPDRIHDLAMFVRQSSLQKSQRDFEDYILCLGCNDRVLRLVQANKLVDEIDCEAAITSLYTDAAGRRVFYGTQAGTLGVFMIQPNGSLKRSGGLSRDRSPSSDAITSLVLYDINADGVEELLVGYGDGMVCVLHIIPTTGEMEPLWSATLGEKVMSVAGGIVTDSTAQPNLLVHLFSGAVVCFTYKPEDPLEAVAVAENAARLAEQRTAVTMKKQHLTQEIAALEAQIQLKAKELAKHSGATAKKAPLVAVASTFHATVTLKPLSNSSALSLVVDAGVALECAVLRCTTAITLMGTETTQLISQTLQPKDSLHTKSLALAKPLLGQQDAASNRRLEVHLWADEGHADTITVTLYATQQPRTAQVKSVFMHALPHYTKVGNLDRFVRPEEVASVLSQVSFEAQNMFTHLPTWLAHLVPDVSDTMGAEAGCFCFACEHSGSVLRVDCTTDAVTFISDSLTALAAIKRFVTTHAARHGVTVGVREHILFASAVRCLGTIMPAMQACAAAARQAHLLEGLSELQGNDTDLHYLPNEMRQVLQAPDAVRAAAAEQKHLETILQRSVLMLYECLSSFKNHAPLLSPPLRAALANCCGCKYSKEGLWRIFFPNDEPQRERDLSVAAQVAASPFITVPELVAEEDCPAELPVLPSTSDAVLQPGL